MNLMFLGHVDPGETEIETAYRETQEEAGLLKKDLHIVDGFKKVLNYEVKGSPKTVIYWLAQLKDLKTPVVLSQEHQRYEWFDVEAAIKCVKFADMGQTLTEAEHFIKNSFKNSL